ncbi:hypothetical protein KI614_11645 [Dechloromonas denitrificans]|uniref:hypothetical protein n=1 Tax=Dechloromonas denitrificans TaxID=281362 RepID=UPI001CF82901|nr:hypothetical protein [Dechloromonas denitrificans]UCV10828.1 hypothetical protein KI614_11645 [Dechloromonas denitrificans]
MTLIIAALLGFCVISCLATFKTILAFIAMAALFYVSLPVFIVLLMILGIIFFYTR